MSLRNYKLVAGIHYNGSTVLEAGAIVTSDEDLAAKFVNKFEYVGDYVEVPVTQAPEAPEDKKKKDEKTK